MSQHDNPASDSSAVLTHERRSSAGTRVSSDLCGFNGDGTNHIASKM